MQQVKVVNTGFIAPGGKWWMLSIKVITHHTWSTTSDRRIKKNIVDNNIGLE